ncbi:MAG: diacylglycerol kinase family protein [Sphingobacteriales bacterium]|nr:diacylglycerol kinase family protein [Sphingobacteriales bacterium]
MSNYDNLNQAKSGRRRFSVKDRLKSFEYAIDGIKIFFRNEHNGWIHLAATIIVIVLAFACEVSANEAIALGFTTGFVWTAELFNTAIEKMMDFISAERKPQIKFIKDISAAAVLVAAVSAFLTGCIVFIPKL